MPVIPPGAARDMRAEVLPPQLLPLFDDDFVRSCDLIEEYVGRVACRVFRDLGGEEAASSPATAAELVTRCGLDPESATVPVDWLARLLASRGLLTRSGEGDEARYRLEGPLPELDPDEPRHEQEAHDPAALPSYDIVAVAADAYPACLRGELSGQQALFAPARLALWSRYFHNDNPLYAINNRIPAMLAAEEAGGDVLELGGGLGSAGVALVEAFEAAGRSSELRSYRFTDISPVFLRRGERAVRAAWEAAGLDSEALRAGRVDIDRDLEAQRLDPESFDLVYAVNTIHVARDLGETLRSIRGVLRPGGRVVFGEGIRPFPGQPIYTEMVFLLLEPFRDPVLEADWRPTGGFLTPEHWTGALESAGFEDARLFPDIARVREHYTSFVVAGLTARRPG